MEYFIVLTAELPDERITLATTVTLGLDATRLSLFTYMRDKLTADKGDRWRQATISYYSAEPNALRH
jgi:hypothetical protein